MIDKIAYRGGADVDEIPNRGPRNDLVESESSTETGARGFTANEMTNEYDATDPDIYKKDHNFKSNNEELDEDIFELLLELGDFYDSKNEKKLADFSDFLLSKFAQTKDIDYTDLYNKLMIRINNSDITNVNETLKKLTNIFSRTLLIEFNKTNDLDSANESAYKKTLHRAEQYMSEG